MFDLTFLVAAKTSFLWALLCLLLLFLFFPAICFVTFLWGKTVIEMDLKMEQRRGSQFGEKERLLGTNAIRHTNYNNQVVRKLLYHTENLLTSLTNRDTGFPPCPSAMISIIIIICILFALQHSCSIFSLLFHQQHKHHNHRGHQQNHQNHHQ